MLADEDGRVAVPTGAVAPGEDPFIAASVRIPLETAGFRIQFTDVVAAADGHVVLWSEGYRYDGAQAHARPPWWLGTVAAAATRLRDQGDDEVAGLVELAGRVRDARTDDDYFAAKRRLLETAYLAADRSNPRAGSGFGGDAVDWAGRRRHLCDAIADGDAVLDVGCANGHLLECLVEWCAADGRRIEPHGVDLSEALVAEAARRLPRWRDRLWVGNALDWCPPDDRRFDVVFVLLDAVPVPRRRDLVMHLRDSVAAPGGRVVCSNYVRRDERDQWPSAVLEALGFAVAGETRPDPAIPRQVPPSAWVVGRADVS